MEGDSVATGRGVGPLMPRYAISGRWITRLAVVVLANLTHLSPCMPHEPMSNPARYR